jgi:hypothetical protein
MKIIITEEQQESLQRKLKKMVKKLGWEKTSIVVNGPKNLAKLAFNNNPYEFLNMFNNLDVVQSEERPDWVLYRFEKGNNMMVYDPKYDEVYINYDIIWSFLRDGFNLNYTEIQKLTKRWLYETYNLRGITTLWAFKVTISFVV